jgi:hypothetical protein
LTGYRISKMTGVAPIKVYAELQRLLRAGIVRKSLTSTGKAGFELADSDIAALMRKRASLVLSETWFRDLDRKAANRRDAIADARAIDLRGFRANRDSVPNRQEFERPASKDAALARAGLPVSRRRVPNP